ncbi:MAG: hypothetical protein JNL81_13150 [Hyphomonadaceae bacterium]|nr:hypothetical protein [Hyphomonadaceae bacterium]
MKVLIVEDSLAKEQRIAKLLIERNGVNAADIAVAKNLTTFYAQTRHESVQFDIIVLDMTFGVHGTSGGREDTAGIEVLQAVLSRGLKTQVIVATQHDRFNYRQIKIESLDDLNDLLVDWFPDHMRGLVEVDLAESEWESRLADLVDRCIKCI